MPYFSYLTDDAEKENTAPSQESSTTLRDCQNDTNEGENCKGELCIKINIIKQLNHYNSNVQDIHSD